jgi:ribosomal protein S30
LPESGYRGKIHCRAVSINGRKLAAVARRVFHPLPAANVRLKESSERGSLIKRLITERPMGKAGEKQKRTPKIKDKRQYERFVETARKLECDESENAPEQAFRKVTIPKRNLHT